jgi:pimeloyl-ACP methyl ester carboxylesterase
MSTSVISTQFLTRANGRIAYDVSGPADGRLLVLAPGMGDVRSAFRFLTPLLVEAGYRVVTCDVRGQGESSVPWSEYGCRVTGEDLLELVWHLGGKAVLVGHSSSASSVIWAAAQAPEAITGLVVMSPFLHRPQLNLLLRAAQFLVTHNPTLWLTYYSSLYKAGKPADFAGYRKALKTNLRESGRMAATAGLIDTHADCNARIRELRQPVLLTMGTADPDFPDATAEARADEVLIAAHTTVTLQLIEGAGHYPHAECPEATAAAILDYLQVVARA